MGIDRKWLEFDPTIHAGHLVTAFSIIGCTFAAWYGLVNRISALELEYAQHDKEIVSMKADAIIKSKDIDTRIDSIVTAQRQEVGKLRDDMNQWFMNLDAKLDRKADKR